MQIFPYYKMFPQIFRGIRWLNRKLFFNQFPKMSSIVTCDYQAVLEHTFRNISLFYTYSSLIFSSRLTCAFLACKVDEFNVSSPQFVGNLRESPLGQEKALDQILEYELLLIQQLNFHLIVHNPYRPFEGFLIDLKVILLM